MSARSRRSISPELRSAIHRWNFHEQLAAQSRRLAGDAENEVRNLIAELVGIDRWYLGWHGPVFGWPCEGSPVGTCVYDRETDRCEDQCIYCGEPHERK